MPFDALRHLSAFRLDLAGSLDHGLIMPTGFASSANVHFNGTSILTQFVVTLWLGVTPQCFLDAMHCSVANILNI